MAQLTRKQKLFICQCFAEFKSHDQIIREFEQEFGFRVYKSRLMYYSHESKWPDLIQDLREAWTKGLVKEAIANKRMRLRMLQKVYDEAMAPAYAGTDKESGKDKFTFTPSAAVSALSQAQDEVEGKQMRVTGSDGGAVKFKVVWDDYDGFGNGDNGDKKS